MNLLVCFFIEVNQIRRLWVTRSWFPLYCVPVCTKLITSEPILKCGHSLDVQRLESL
jgi:hypothetical protein